MWVFEITAAVSAMRTGDGDRNGKEGKRPLHSCDRCQTHQGQVKSAACLITGMRQGLADYLQIIISYILMAVLFSQRRIRCNCEGEEKSGRFPIGNWKLINRQSAAHGIC